MSCGFKVFPTHFQVEVFASTLPSYITAEQPFRHRKCESHVTVSQFKASNQQLGSAMKSDNEQSDLPTVTHQNGFSSTITIGVPTFISRLIGVSILKPIHLYIQKRGVNRQYLRIIFNFFSLTSALACWRR